MVHFASLVLGLLAACAPLSFASPVEVANPQGSSIGTLVKLRIEGADKTIFEGVVQTKPRNLTTASGGTHHCEYLDVLSLKSLFRVTNTLIWQATAPTMETMLRLGLLAPPRWPTLPFRSTLHGMVRYAFPLKRTQQLHLAV